MAAYFDDTLKTSISVSCIVLILTASPLFALEQRLVDYKITPQDTLRVHLFLPADCDSPRAAIVFFFGGGWNNGSPSQFFEHCKYFASRGMVAFAADYRVKSRHGTTPFECVEDGKSAVRWIRMHAADYNIDPNKIVASGGSAGGHVAACTAVIEGFDDPDENLQISSKPNALVLFNPVIDTWRDGYGMKKIGDNARDISPAHHVRPGLPPTIIFHGTEDTTVPIENVERFCRLMHEAGNECTLLPFSGHKHGFFNYGRFDNEPFKQTIRAADEFLIELGFLSGTPTITR